MFLKNSIWSFTAAVFRAAGTLIVNKLFAVYLGASGLTLLAHFQNLIGIGTQIPNDGINRGLIKYQADEHIDESFKKELFYTALILNGALFGLILFAFLYFNEFFLAEFGGVKDQHTFLWILFVAIFLFMLNLMLHSFLLALQRIKAYAFIHVLSVFMIVAFAYGGVSTGELEIALISFTVGQSLGLFLSFYYCKRHHLIPSLKHVKFSKDAFGKIFQFLWMATSVLVLEKLVSFIIRDLSIDTFGLQTTGYWQAVVKISDNFMMFFISIVAVIFYPQVALLIHEKNKLRKYVLDVYKIIIPATVILLLLVYMLRGYVIILLYSKEFIEGEALLKYQLPGDFFRIAALLLVYVISAKAKTLQFIILQAFSALVYVGLIFLIINQAGIASFPIAYLISNIAFFGAVLYASRNLLMRQ